MPTTLTIVVSLVVVNFVLREAVFERAKVRAGRIKFPPIFSFRLALWMVAPLALYATARLFAEVRSQIDWIYPILTGLFSIAVIVYQPSTITIDNNGLSSANFLGLRKKNISWANASSVTDFKVTKNIVVCSTQSECIEHTRFHVDPHRFLMEITNRMAKRSAPQ